MIDIDDDAIVRRRDTADGRFLIFHRVDLPSKSTLPWSGVVLDTEGDGFGIQVALDSDGEAWSACDLLRIAIARAKAEEDRRLGPLVLDIQQHLGLALQAEHRRLGREPPDHLLYAPGALPSPYQWTVTINGPHHLPLCPDPTSRDEGVAPEQVLMVLEQAYADAKVPMAQLRWVAIAHQHVKVALDAERQRVTVLRGVT